MTAVSRKGIVNDLKSFSDHSPSHLIVGTPRLAIAKAMRTKTGVAAGKRIRDNATNVD